MATILLTDTMEVAGELATLLHSPSMQASGTPLVQRTQATAPGI